MKLYNISNMCLSFLILSIYIFVPQTKLVSQTNTVDQQFSLIRTDIKAVDVFSQSAAIGLLSPILRQELEDSLVKGIEVGRIQRAHHFVPYSPSTITAVAPSKVESKKGRFNGFTGRISFVSFLDGTASDIIKIRFETPSDVVRYYFQSGNIATETYMSLNSLHLVTNKFSTDQEIAENELVIPLDTYDLGSGHESIRRFIGLHIFPRIIYEGDTDSPLTFVILHGRGFVYLCGKGRVSLKNEKGNIIRVINFPKDFDTVLID